MSVNSNSIKWSAAALALALSLATTAALGCGGGNGNDLPEEATWESTIDTGITEKIETEAGEDDVVLGDINEHGVEIFVPGGAFQEPAQISLSGAEEEVKVDLAKYSPQSSLYSLKFTGEQPRTDLPVEVTTAVDKETLAAAEETGGYRALHYNEEFGWEHKRPVEVNQEKGYVVFETYHNFLWGTAELTEEERIDSYLDEMSQEQWARGQIGEDMEGLTKEVVDEMIMGAFDEHNPDIAQHILSEVTDEVVGSLDAPEERDQQWLSHSCFCFSSIPGPLHHLFLSGLSCSRRHIQLNKRPCCLWRSNYNIRLMAQVPGCLERLL